MELVYIFPVGVENSANFPVMNETKCWKTWKMSSQKKRPKMWGKRIVRHFFGRCFCGKEPFPPSISWQKELCYCPETPWFMTMGGLVVVVVVVVVAGVVVVVVVVSLVISYHQYLVPSSLFIVFLLWCILIHLSKNQRKFAKRHLKEPAIAPGIGLKKAGAKRTLA